MELNKVYLADNLELLKTMPNNYFSSIVTDPPYEIGFMNRKWDGTGITYSVPFWEECLRVLKPGGYLLSFGGSRTYHRMACAIEDAGFEIRDQIMWIYGSGFPKSYNIAKGIEGKLLHGSANTKDYCKLEKTNLQQQGMGFNNIHLEQGDRPASYELGGTFDLDAQTIEAKQWDGWGTALKPAHEPIVVARKPLGEKTVAENVLKWGTGGINIDSCRISTDETLTGGGGKLWSHYRDNTSGKAAKPALNTSGRFPTNLILDKKAGQLLDEQSGNRKSGGKVKGNGPSRTGQNGIYSMWGRVENQSYNDSGGASRFFYCAKASKHERGEGNSHPTVKPLTLMRYLVKLVTPPNGIVLDPFAGSGTACLACIYEDFDFVGIEKEKGYVKIANKRIQTI